MSVLINYDDIKYVAIKLKEVLMNDWLGTTQIKYMKEPVGFTLEVMLILYNVGYKLNKNNIYKFK